jgi:hypothetical protein
MLSSLLPRTLVLLLTVAAVGLLGPSRQVANATHVNIENLFFVSVHFDGVAWGKRVASVTARVVLESRGPMGSTVAASEDVSLELRGDHFFGKTQLKGRSDNGVLSVSNPKVTYFVVFADGTTRISESFDVPVVDDAPATAGNPAAYERQKRLQTEADAREDATQTEARASRIGWIS